MATSSYDYSPLSQSVNLGSPPHPRISTSSHSPTEDNMWFGGKLSFKWTIANKNIRMIMYLLLLVSAMLLIRHVYNSETEPVISGPLFQIPPHLYIGKPSDFSIPKKEFDWYAQNCYKGKDLGRSISDIYAKLGYLKNSSNTECQTIWHLFDSMLSMEYIEAAIVIPQGFQSEVKGWLGNDSKLYEQVKHQKVYKVVTKGSHEETVFNPLRSKRPTSKSSINLKEYIANLTKSTQATCDFCKYKDHTAEDVFGRIDNKYSASASNTFKLAKFHGLFFPKTHHPVDITYEALSDLFINTSQQWFETAYKLDTTQRYPSLLWDVLPHAGASQVHPHVHGMLGVHQYSGAFEKLHAISQEYYAKYHRLYWSDLILVHWALGLALRVGEAVAIVPLFARKDHEYMIFSPEVDEDFVTLVYTILEGYKNNLGSYCFSSGGAYHFLGTSNPEIDTYSHPGLPVTFRFGSRGVCTSVSSDVSSLELYTVNNINSDLAATFYALQKSIDSFKDKNNS